MKTKLLFICTVFFAMSYSNAQVYVYDAFDYGPVGSSLLDGTNTNAITSTIWLDRQGGDDDLLIEADPRWALSQGFDLNPTGNAIRLQGGGEDAALKFATPLSGAGTSVYLSFLLDVKGWDATNGINPSDYMFVHFGVARSGSETNFNARPGLYVGPGASGNTFKLGVSNADVSPTWYDTEYNFTDLGDENATVETNQFFIVIKFTFGGDGTSADTWMWVNPAIVNTEPASDVAHTSVSKIRTELVAVNIEASSNDRTPDSYIDELRVTGTWAEAVGLAAVASVSDNVLNDALSVYPNPSKGSLNISTNGVALKTVNLLDLTGKTIYSSTSSNTIDTSKMAKGLYLLKVTADDGATASRKVVLQ
jgi:hypothetical protein